MGNELWEDENKPSGILSGITFEVLTQADIEKISVLSIDTGSKVSDPRLGLPNPLSYCNTCDAKDIKGCEGHFGHIEFPFTILHPYFLLEAAQILNKVCAGCKSIRQDRRIKDPDSVSSSRPSKGCRYCIGNASERYPSMVFKVSSKDVFRKSAIVVEAKENLKRLRTILPSDYWDFIPKDEQQEESNMKPNIRVLSHAQVHFLLKDVNPNLIKKFITRPDSLFLNCFPVTPNSQRVTEFITAFSNGQTLVFDERTRFYKKLIDFRGIANELGSRTLDCLKISKLNSEKLSSEELAIQKKFRDSPSKTSGLRWIKDVIIGKRSDHCFRMVVTGDPNLKLNEIGIPCHIAERMYISECLNRWNIEKPDAFWNLRLIEEGQISVRRKGNLVRVRLTDQLQIGDIIYRPLNDGDIVLINRPPSIHQHSLIALSVKVLPVESVVCINPLCCSPFRGDFDGDCLHGYVPQSIVTRVELKELVALDKQLIDGQNGRNLLSLSQDSLTAAHLVMEDGILLNTFQMQQLEMLSLHQQLLPASTKTSSLDSRVWTGKQLFSLLLPSGFNYASDRVNISDGKLISSYEGSSCLQDTDNNLFQSLIKYSQGYTLDILDAAQRVLCEWLSMQGFSVSLYDLILTSDSYLRKKMMDQVFCGLQEAELACAFKQLLSFDKYLTETNENNGSSLSIQVEHLCYEKQKYAAIIQVSVDAFKKVFRDIQSLAYKYAGNENSLLTMFKAGSKGNLLKLVQHSMCLGLQHSLVSLSFRIPHQLTCAAWNNHKTCDLDLKPDSTLECDKSYIPYAVVESSFLTGLNPLESFVHSVTSRDSSFSGNADLPGFMTRRLKFFMRDLYVAYDGTVRNAYGNQLVQFSYNTARDTTTPDDTIHNLRGENLACTGIGGQPVGLLSACAISEAAYSALDQPISVLETSPLLNLKKVLECGSKKNSSDQTMSLYLSKKLGRQRHGFEYAALEIKNHLERLLFSDIVSTVLIIFSPQSGGVQERCSPWVCHFHIRKDILRRRKLKVLAIIDSLSLRCKSARTESKIDFSCLHFTSSDCSVTDTWKDCDTCCISATIVEKSKNSFLQLDIVQELVIPFLLGTVVKGFLEIQKVDILWRDQPKVSKAIHGSFGELYLRVSMSRDSGKKRLWSILINGCLQIMETIDWSRSHPDNIYDFCLVYGVDAGWKYFLNSLESAISDVGKTLLPEHLLLMADSLSLTGEFVSLNAKGLAQQMKHASVSSPFMQACFSNPGNCFIKAAKAGMTDNLLGSMDALGWGKVPSLGTGYQFEFVYSPKGHELAKPVDVYNVLGTQFRSDKILSEGHVKLDLSKFMSDERMLKKILPVEFVLNMDLVLKRILNKYPINHKLNEEDKRKLIVALHFHPKKDVKIGAGVQDIKVGYHPKYDKSHCFILERKDGTIEDFSYRKCITRALEIVAPARVKGYQSKMLKHFTDKAREDVF